ncbi:hypothetical protein Lal_00042195 [Lupinus albus]|nr:hypothetical protein Lal_00042195 [Lupinus albus]
MEIFDTMIRRRINFMFHQETKWVGEKARESSASSFKLWCTSTTTSRNGVDMIVDKESKKDVVGVKKIGDRIISLNLCLYTPCRARGIPQDKILEGFGRRDLNGHVRRDTREFEGFNGLWHRGSKYGRRSTLSHESGVVRSHIDFFRIRKSDRKLCFYYKIIFEESLLT